MVTGACVVTRRAIIKPGDRHIDPLQLNYVEVHYMSDLSTELAGELSRCRWWARLNAWCGHVVFAGAILSSFVAAIMTAAEPHTH